MHPDFSTSGSPLYFGWLLSRLPGSTDQPYTDLDDMLITFHTAVPEPSAVLGATLAAVMLLRRRR
jgi:hypothetical protein